MRSPVPLIAASLAMACGYGASDEPDVGSSPWDTSATHRLEVVEEAVIGGYRSGPGHELAGVGYGALLPSGGFVISTRAQRELWMFDAEGDFVRAVGRRGSGPGEFQSILGVAALPSGSLVVWDQQLSRLSFFTSDGEVSSTVTPEGFFWGTFVAAASDSVVVFRTGVSVMGMRDNSEGIRRDSVAFLGVSRSGRSWTIAKRLGPQRYFYSRNQTWGIDDLLFGVELLSATRDGALLLASTDSAAVTAVDTNGEIAERVAIEAPRLEVTEAMISRQRARRVAQVSKDSVPIQTPGPSPQDIRRALVVELPVAAYVPVFGAFTAAGADGYWMRPFSIDADADQLWFRVDGELSPVGWIELEVSAEILAADERRLLIVTIDSLGVETVTMKVFR